VEDHEAGLYGNWAFRKPTGNGPSETVMNRHQHWDRVYTIKGERDVSWFEPLAVVG